MRRSAALACAAGFCGFLIFLPSISHGWTNYDDPMFLLGETGWRGLGPSAWAWAFSSKVGCVYQPLAWLTYGLDYSLWGMDARGYHLQSALWHGLAAGLLFLVFRRLLELSKSGGERELDAAAIFSALAFALHPLRVESVSWAAERRDVVCAAFAAAAVLAYLKPRRSLAAVTGFLFLSLLAKGMTLTVPVALLALDFYPLKRIGPKGEGLREAIVEKWPLFALSVVFGLAGTMAQDRIRWTLAQHGVLSRVAQAGYALAFYARKTVWSSGLMPLYELRPPLDPFAPEFLLSAAAVVAAAAFAWTRRRRQPWLAASFFWYAVLLFPVSGLFQFGPQLVADRYSLIACWPLAVLAGAALRTLEARRAAAAGGAILVALAIASTKQQSYWANSEDLWTRVLSADPGCATAHGSLGVLRATSGRFDEAKAEFQRAIDAFPGCVADQERLAVLIREGVSSEEERRLRAAVEVNAVCRKARSNTAAVLAQTGDLKGALKILEDAVLLDPADQGASLNLAHARAASRGTNP